MKTVNSMLRLWQRGGGGVRIFGLGIILAIGVLCQPVQANPNQHQITAQELQQRRAMYQEYLDRQEQYKKGKAKRYYPPKGFYVPKPKKNRVGRAK